MALDLITPFSCCASLSVWCIHFRPRTSTVNFESSFPYSSSYRTIPLDCLDHWTKGRRMLLWWIFFLVKRLICYWEATRELAYHSSLRTDAQFLLDSLLNANAMLFKLDLANHHSLDGWVFRTS
jgi:hypothetical protein